MLANLKELGLVSTEFTPKKLLTQGSHSTKKRKSLNPNSNISIRYPAKLVMDGQVIRDMFPDWARIMKQNRLNMQGYTETQSISASVSKQVFHNDQNAWSDESETEHDSELTQTSPGMSQLPRTNRTAHGASSRPPRSPALQPELTQTQIRIRQRLDHRNVEMHRYSRSVPTVIRN